MRKRITLKDIAKELNVSVATVSKALKNYPDVSPETKSKVQDLVKQWNYRPNSMAVNLRQQKSGIIGVIVPEIVHHFFSEIIAGIIREAEKNSYMVLVFQSDEKLDTEIKQCELLLDYGVDGVLISVSNQTTTFAHLENLQKNGVHVVQFDKIVRGFKSPKVVIDDYQAAYNITEHLIKKGRKTIAHIAGPIEPRNAKDRLKGYRDALIKNNLFFDEKMVLRTQNSTFDEGYEYAKKVLKKHQNIDAIFCVTDMIAIGAMTAIKEQGKAIPKDVSVVGFSNWFMSSVVSPSLTTVDQPGETIGIEAVHLLMDEIKDKNNDAPKDFTDKKVIVPTELILRESS